MKVPSQVSTPGISSMFRLYAINSLIRGSNRYDIETTTGEKNKRQMMYVACATPETSRLAKHEEGLIEVIFDQVA